MIQRLFAIPPVDSVYWTLLVEFLFYTLAFLLFVTRSIPCSSRARHIAFLRLVYWALAVFAHVDLPWRISQLLVLDAVPFFALGIIAFRLVRDPSGLWVGNIFSAFSILVLWVTDSLLVACVGVVCFVAVWLAATGRLPILRMRLLV
jgi:hypothetical protein